MESLGSFLVFLVTSFLLFIFLYARYSKFENDLSKRQTELAQREEKINLKIKAMDEEMALKRAEITTVSERVEGLRQELGI